MFASPAWSKMLEHASKRPPQPPGHVSDIYDGALVKCLLRQQVFENSKYCITLLGGCDGADATKGKKGEDYSVHPIIMVILILSAEIWYTFDFVCVRA